MRAVVDTNVFISGLLKRNTYPAKVLDAWVFNRFYPLVSKEIVGEYSRVLVRDKFKILGSVDKRLKIIQKFVELPWVYFVYPLEKIEIIDNDPADNRVLECAEAGEADFIVTGDQHLLELKAYKNIKIVTPEEFIEIAL
ncbi:nucleotide-binding protein [Carboxydothermus islandicus]|uniref:Nucleotide-binding protein n=1 Tax=Carboxydothermus islandicus TaxID=661089 RepID=A0A1L8CZB1_9THEO|nr:putative toxin-antitoxin system toxin component, PIN family [Carboxydothermus islandicus]GAV24199.1 nucleotide-binding protein [Carboxydothermus islandicus]